MVTVTNTNGVAAISRGVESAYAWWRLLASLVLSTIGGVGMWSVVVALPYAQAEFEVARGGASLPYTATMLGFAAGSVVMGRFADRFGALVPVICSALVLGLGYAAAAFAASLWFNRRRGIAVAICASGSYLAGTVWPPILQPLIQDFGWRRTYLGIALFCVLTMVPLALVALRQRKPAHAGPTAARAKPISRRTLDISPNALQALLIIAGFACCVAMSMPQVHIVAYCGDLGYGVARGAEMLSLMLGTGVVSRLASGWISDRIGGVRTLLLGSALQCLTLVFYLPFDGLMSLYVVSALFGLSQGGIVPSYAMIVREYFPPEEAATRIGWALMATIVGMAFGGWVSGVIFDASGSYRLAFLNGILWNVLNLSIAWWLLLRQRRPLHA